MGPSLYLDTARLGQMSPSAQRAQQDFARMAGEVGAAIQFEDLLKHGVEACCSSLRRRVPGLEIWRGVAGFKQSLRRLAGLHDDLPLLLAARSAELMKLAALLLCRPCRHVLVTDLGWPPYRRFLEAECRRTRRRVTTVAVAQDIFSGNMAAEEVVARIRRTFFEYQCDGLFLTAVSHTGVRLPIPEITLAVGEACRFVIVDGAQDFCHVASGELRESCDLYLAGCHKWLGGFHPLGVACYGRRRSSSMIETVLRDAIEAMQVDDPLLRFVEMLEGKSSRDSGETVNLTPLFSSAGAVEDASQSERDGHVLQGRLKNANVVAEVAANAGWAPRIPDSALRSGIVMLQSESSRTCELSPEVLRRAFQERDIALSTYEGGLVRLSMPASPLHPRELDLLADALTWLNRPRLAAG